MVVTGEFIPENEEPQVSATNVGTLKATTSDEDKYCMLDSGANVMVVPLMRNMKGDKTMCSLVGENKTQGLIRIPGSYSRLQVSLGERSRGRIFPTAGWLWRISTRR